MTPSDTLRVASSAFSPNPSSSACDPELAAIRAAAGQHRLLLIACGTGVNSAVVESENVVFRVWEAGKLPTNAWLGGDASYPIVLNRYAGLKRTSIRISESLGYAKPADTERISLKQFVALLSPGDRANTLANRDVPGASWSTADLAHVLRVSPAELATLSVADFDGRLVREVIPVIEACLRRAGEFLLDSVFSTRFFYHSIDAFMVAGHLNGEARPLVEQGLLERAKLYGVRLEELVPGVLCYAIKLEDPQSPPSEVPPIRTAAEFQAELQAALERFALTSDATAPAAALADYLPLVPALRLLERVAGDGVARLPIDAGAVRWTMPVLPDWPRCPEWVQLAANSAHAFVASAALLGLTPPPVIEAFDSPDRIYRATHTHARSTSLASQFAARYSTSGYWVLGLYRETHDLVSGETVSLTRPFRSRLEERLQESSPPKLIGVDIGRTKVRAVTFEFDSATSAYAPVGRPIEFPPPRGLGVAGVIHELLDKLAGAAVGADGESICVGVCWPGAVSCRGEISGFSGILADVAGKGNPPDGVWNTTPELLAGLKFRDRVRAAFPNCRTFTMNDLSAWQIGASAIASPALPGPDSLARFEPSHLAPLGAAIAAWLWGD